MAKLFLINSEDIGALIVSDGPQGSVASVAEYDPEVETQVKRVRDNRPAGTIIGAEFAGDAPRFVMFRSDDPETAKRLAANIRRSLGEYTAAHNLKAAEMRRFADRDDTLYLFNFDDKSGAYYRVDDTSAPSKLFDANGEPADAGEYGRRDEKPVLRAVRRFRVGEGGIIDIMDGDTFTEGPMQKNEKREWRKKK